MSFRRVIAAAGALVFAVSVSGPAFAQDKPPAQPAQAAQTQEQQRKLSNDERRDYTALSDFVDAVAGGKQPAAADLKLKFQYHYLKSNENVYLPYIVEVSGGKFSSFPVTMYVRVTQKGAAPPAGKGSEANWPFADVYFLTEKNVTTNGDVTEVPRALQLPPGEYTITIALRERPGRDKKVPPKTAMLTQDLSVPDLNKGLTTSSVILASALNPAPEQLTAQQQLERPFTFSGYEVVPSFGKPIPQSGELMFVFFIYNEGVASTGKPDLDVDYLFYRGNEDKPFTKLATQSFNATTLPGQFDVKAGHQVFVGQGIPVKGAIAAGDYKMEIKITDKTNSQSVTRNVAFTVLN
jgi:hypothetical protein